MKIKLLVFLVGLAFLGNAALAQQPFDISARRVFVVTQTGIDSLSAMDAGVTPMDKMLMLESGASITITTGPEEDMLSFRTHGLRNPMLMMKPHATVRITFINSDEDMTHDLRIGDLAAPFERSPDTTKTVGSSRLPHSNDEHFYCESFTITATREGMYHYLCSVRGHAAGGMWGELHVMADMMPMDSMHPMMPADSMKMGNMDMGGMSTGSMAGMGSMSSMSGVLLTHPMSEDASGTSWQPASTPMYAIMKHAGDWMLMLHGAIMPRYDHQGGPRGDSKFDAPNWLMLMASHPVGSMGQFSSHVMLSLDPITESGKGYPLLLQTGESYQGKKLVDYQHPHDLFSEVAVSYGQQIADRSSVYLYAGYPGEPALGPPAFMHRSSAFSNPNAPLGHHWMDATHITFGVLTAGFAIGSIKLEGSYFNGSEPDENRFNFDPLKLNSYSGRVTYNPLSELSLQASSGFIRDPESNGVDVVRTTASGVYTKELMPDSWWSATLAWGQNHEVGALTLQALLLESEYAFSGWSVYGRGEYVQKSNEELDIPNPDVVHDVEELMIGATRKLITLGSIDIDLGLQGTLNVVPPSLQSLYGKTPTAYEIYLAVHPMPMQ